MKTRLDREHIYKIIDEERFYQDSKWDDMDSVNNVADFIIYMETYLEAAKRINNPKEKDQSLDHLRKVVALGVACFEKFGVPARR